MVFEVGSHGSSAAREHGSPAARQHGSDASQHIQEGDHPAPTPCLGPTGKPGPDFTRPVPPGGYAWWYVDALSDDGQHGLTLIGFVGSVFSPYYALAGRRRPENHCSMNVALYGTKRAWAMTERGKGALDRSHDHLQIGPSAMVWDDTGLTVTIRERGAPLPHPVRGTVRLIPEHLNTRAFKLDDRGRHVWRPITLRARVEVTMEAPALSWTGNAYFDSNWGAEPLPTAFRRWDWMRGIGPDGSVSIIYDVTPRPDRGPETVLSLRAAPGKSLEDVPAPPRIDLRSGPLWRVKRAIRTDNGALPCSDTFMEDTPFYTRSTVKATLFGAEIPLIHESMDLDRLGSRWVPFLLPFRMPRRP